MNENSTSLHTKSKNDADLPDTGGAVASSAGSPRLKKGTMARHGVEGFITTMYSRADRM